MLPKMLAKSGRISWGILLEGQGNWRLENGNVFFFSLKEAGWMLFVVRRVRAFSWVAGLVSFNVNICESAGGFGSRGSS